MNRVLPALVGAIAEAWAELRIHRTRVLLSLIGVAVAVCALTTVVGLGAVAEQSQRETTERNSGRPATLSLNAYDPVSGATPTVAQLRDAYSTALERYDIQYSSFTAYTNLRVQFAGGVRDVQSIATDVDYGTMRRVQMLEGRWFGEDDRNRLAPAMIVNSSFLRELGLPGLTGNPTVLLPAAQDTTAVLIGVTPDQYDGEPPAAYILIDAYERVLGPGSLDQSFPSFETWVPPEIADQLTERLRGDLAAALPGDMQVDVNRQDYAQFGEDPFLPLKLLVGGVAALVLLLGALGLVNISLVTVRQRIREIGVRRSFGATAGRVFFAVMMESIVATFAAGVIGVLAAVAIVKSPWVTDFLGQGVTELPPFPVSAAILGLGASLAVGALAGLLPALVAVRVKVIDAIRY
ncbi:ABC transporter permease [Planctomonas psychrotolerans]|uniref:ABC transporter permease n=1 Tax=Planctomonas psychrotolerans TaxID=2528712 RepID=UPI00123A611E|nr:ABC transporter permease [Planctomonas psychrotolerans]